MSDPERCGEEGETVDEPGKEEDIKVGQDMPA